MNQKKLRPNARQKGYLYILISAVLWGTPPIFSTLSYRYGSDALTSAAMRSYLSCAIFLIWMLANGSLKKLKLREIPFYLIYGVVAGGCTFACYMTAIEHLSIAMAAILLYTSPAFVILINRVVYKEPITRVKLLAVLCTFGGCLLVLQAYHVEILAHNLPWVGVGLAAGVCFSMTTVVGKKAKEYHDGRFNAGMMCIFGSLVFLAVKPPWSVAAISFRLWLCFGGLAVFGTVLAYMVYLKGLDIVADGGSASIIATLEPIVGSVFGVIFFGDKLEVLQIFGILLVVIGVSLPILCDFDFRQKTNLRSYGKEHCHVTKT